MLTPKWLSRRFLRWVLLCALIGICVPPAFHFAAKKFDPYKLAIKTARQNREFVNVLGNPVKEGWFFDGEEQFGDPATAKMLIPVRGSTRAGSLRARAIKDHGRWRLAQLTLELTEPDQSIDLLGQNPI